MPQIEHLVLRDFLSDKIDEHMVEINAVSPRKGVPYKNNSRLNGSTLLGFDIPKTKPVVFHQDSGRPDYMILFCFGDALSAQFFIVLI
jgi:hypothetical protein